MSGGTTNLGEALDVAVDRGIIDADQADRIRSLAQDEPAREDTSGTRRRRILAEAIGYLGGALATVAALLLISRIWPDLQPWARVSLPAVVSLGLLSAGTSIGAGAGPSARLRAFLWASSTAAAAGSVAVGLSEYATIRGEQAALLVGLVTIVHGGLLWRRRVSGLQQVVVFVGTMVAVIAGVGILDSNLDQMIGLAVWAVGVTWALLAYARWLPPEATGLLLGAGAALVGPFMTGQDQGFPWMLSLGLLTSAALIILGSLGGQTMPLGLGVAGIFIYIPRLVLEQFGDTIGAPAGLLITGVLLVAVSVLIAQGRTGRRRGAGHG